MFHKLFRNKMSSLQWSVSASVCQVHDFNFIATSQSVACAFIYRWAPGPKSLFRHGYKYICIVKWDLVLKEERLLALSLTFFCLSVRIYRCCSSWTDFLQIWLIDWLIDEWMVGWMDGWMDGWVDGWMEGWMDDRYFLTVIALTPNCSNTVHIYTQTIHKATQLIWEECGPCPVVEALHEILSWKSKFG